jgi:hypothetical protein
MIMRFAFAGVALLMLAGAAKAQDNPACAKFKNDFEYNACLAKIGPKAGVTHSTAAPAYDVPAVAGHNAMSVTRNKRGRAEAVFDITPKR